ncbi:MAG: hypothetical protein ABJC63_10800 [Gemmatimonadales bacterium]
MTEVQSIYRADLKTALGLAAAAAGHEARNALNGLVVNLEVVRAMAKGAGHDAEPFMSQAIAQSEESIRLSEAAIALLNLVVAALNPDGSLVFELREPGQISLNGGADAERLSAALQPLADRGAIGVERSGSTVILRIPVERHE